LQQQLLFIIKKILKRLTIMNKNVGIQCGLGNQLNLSALRYKNILEYNNINVHIIELKSGTFLNKLKNIDIYIFPYTHCDSEIQIADTLMPVVENIIGIDVFPNRESRWHYNDKIKGDILLRQIDAPIVDTWVFWNIKEAIEWVEQVQYPIIFKLKGGASSLNVVKIESKKEAIKVIKKVFSYSGIKNGKIPSLGNLHFLRDFTQLFGVRRRLAETRGKLGPEGAFPYWQTYRDQVIFQYFIPDNAFDTRVTIIGNSAFSFRRFNRKDDYRASGSGNIDYDVSKVDPRTIALAFEISNKLNFQSMAYDFLFDEHGEPRIVEISYTYSDVAVYNCPGYFDSAMEWHEGHVWPQLLILRDLLQEQSLQQPADLSV